MNQMNFQALEEVAEAYEQRLVPVLFRQWTDRLVDAAGIRPGQQVLDVACGTGILARTIAERIGHGGSVCGLDVNPAMLAVARRISPDIDWREGSAEAMPFDDDTYDAVLCQFGLMLFAAPETALREMMRVLKPEARLAAAVFDSVESLPAYDVMADVYARLVDKGVGEALRAPFSLGETDALASRFAAADIGSADITSHQGTARFSSVRHMVLSDVKGWFPFAGIHLDESTIDAVVRQAEQALRPYQAADGALEFPLSVHIVTATKS